MGEVEIHDIECEWARKYYMLFYDPRQGVAGLR